MAPEAVTSDRIYALLKADLMRGMHHPGEMLVERRIAAQFGVSISPVRASAYRLVGERMLEQHSAGGFSVPQVTEAGLRDLYFWHGQLVRSAVNARTGMADRRTGNVPDLALLHGNDVASMARALFDGLAASSGNGEIVTAIRGAGERLHAVRLREQSVLNGVSEEITAVQAVTSAGSGSDLVRAIWAYHRRRLRRIPELVTAMHRPNSIL